MKNILSLIIGVLLFNLASGQSSNPNPPGGGAYYFEKTACLTNEKRAEVNKRVTANIEQYNIQLSQNKSQIVRYDWPIMQNPAFDFNSTYAISNYVDHNANANQLQDYNCGTHTYDTNSGYNHQGIDIFLWPFDENQVDNNQTWAVAAAPGVILGKQDGNADNNCSFNSLPANYIILEHADGSRSWYWHLKLNSLTSKNIGATVATGEYLGVVASSGNSTGPHLHFECYDTNLNLIDPYTGSCNGMNNVSYWNNQKSYWESTVNTVLTHSSPPVLNACPNLDVPNIATRFYPGDLVYFVGYFHDYQTTDLTTWRIKYPNGTIWQSWTQNPPTTYRASYWYWSYFLPTNVTGDWTFEITLDGNTVARQFYVGFCDDGIQNGDETGVDCGGTDCPPCEVEVSLDICAVLESVYDENTGTMSTELENLNLLPTSQPYNQSPWNYTGTETRNISNVADWVLVSFRTGIAASTEIAKTAALLQSDGCINFPASNIFSTNLNVPLYIVIEHLNHLPVMSPQPVNIVNGILTYDFRLANGYLAGSGTGQKQFPDNTWVMLAGDINQDYDINGADKGIWAANNGLFNQYNNSDINRDADVNGGDKSEWVANNGLYSSVPK